MAEAFNLLFFPRLREGANQTEVITQLSATLNVDRAKVAGWFESGKPTVLLKDVAADVAERYRLAIIECGGVCNVQPSDGDRANLSLVPKPLATELFYCPACEYEEIVPAGTAMEECPKCGLVLAKWQERLREEKEKEDIRRRLLRDARLHEDDAQNVQQRRDELARLRALERELMLELGLRPPGRFGLFFGQHPFSVSAAIALLLVSFASLSTFFVMRWIDDGQAQALVAMPASEEIQSIAPVVAAAMQLSLNGNGQVVTEVAQVTELLRQGSVQQADLLAATEQLMKGAGPAAFMAKASASDARPNPFTRTADGKGQGRPVNVDTLGGVSGLVGVRDFDVPEQALLNAANGADRLLAAMVAERQVPDPDKTGATMTVAALERLDGSKIVDMMQGLATDREWDSYINRNVGVFLAAGQFDAAAELSQRIKGVEARFKSMQGMLIAQFKVNAGMDMKLPLARLRAEAARLEGGDQQARLLLELGEALAVAGVPEQPRQAMAWVEELAADLEGSQAAAVTGQLALAYLQLSDVPRSRVMFGRALAAAAAIEDVGKRISAFVGLAEFYQLGRNTTLANEILAEAQVQAATRLGQRERSASFAEIAMVQGVMGDIDGAMASVNNAAEGAGREQLLAALADRLLDREAYRQAQGVMDQLQDQAAVARLAIRMITQVYYAGDAQRAKLLLAEYSGAVRQIADLGQQGLLLGQYARLYARTGQQDMAQSLFDEVKQIGRGLTGRKIALNKGLMALNQARSLWLEASLNTLEEIDSTFVRDPLYSEVMVIKRTLTTLMPKAVQAQVR